MTSITTSPFRFCALHRDDARAQTLLAAKHCWRCQLRHTLVAAMTPNPPVGLIDGCRPRAYTLRCVPGSWLPYILNASLPQPKSLAANSQWSGVLSWRKLVAQGLVDTEAHKKPAPVNR